MMKRMGKRRVVINGTLPVPQFLPSGVRMREEVEGLDGVYGGRCVVRGMGRSAFSVAVPEEEG